MAVPITIIALFYRLYQVTCPLWLYTFSKLLVPDQNISEPFSCTLPTLAFDPQRASSLTLN